MLIFSRDELPERLRHRIEIESSGSVKEFAAKYQRTPATIHRILSGARIPDKKLMKRLGWEMLFAEYPPTARKPGRTRKEKP